MPKTRGKYGEKRRQYLGRVANRCKVKKVQLLNLGVLITKPGWHNAGYIFPKGYEVNIDYRKITDPTTQDVYQCKILEKNSRPLFSVRSTSLKRTFTGKSPTACWKQILDCINQTLVANGQQPSKTQVAGPEYFGLNDPKIVESIEELDTRKFCDVYWKEKERLIVAREQYLLQHPKSERKQKSKRTHIPRAYYLIEEDYEETYTGVWSSIERRERYEKRSGTILVDDDNPIPKYLDAVTMSPIVNPYISPYGHILGYHTWVQCLKDGESMCPFTKQHLILENLTRLTKANYNQYEVINQRLKIKKRLKF